ncbi:hypothetical protein YTPLAS18_05840 [Nitrospira sp.]|nr:hypothetical protein YTPLAS18_05840 [Nitrospira sp.]
MLAGILGGVVLLSGCAGTSGARGPVGPDDPETTVPKVSLPAVVPSVHALQFEDPGDGTLVKPRGSSPLGGISTEAETGPTESADLIARAVANDRVKLALGDRYQFIGSERVEAGKRVRHGCCAAAEQVHRLTFYSYSNRTAVVALMKGEHVAEVTSRPGYQPPETQQEAEEAIALVRQDTRLAGKLDGLDGHVILTEPGEGLIWNDPGYGHRVLWVTFSKGLEGRPLYWALVDLDERAVLKAHEEPQD